MTRILAASLALMLLGAAPAAAETPRVIGWEDLVPPGPPLEHPFAHLSNDHQYALETIYLLGIREQRGQITQLDPEYERGQELTRTLTAEGLDVEGLLTAFAELHAEVTRRNAAVVGDLDGTLVRLPGYALPLEFTETAIDELLLVPYVGACIHVPPPPINQTVFVELEQSYLPESLYAPVWITGRMKVQQSSKALWYVDGEASVDTGYTLEGIRIEPYQ